MKFIIIGMGQFGRSLATQLIASGYEVTILDNNEDMVTEMKDKVTYAHIGDATDIRVLKQLGVDGEDVYVVVAIGESFEKSILIAAQLKEAGVKHLYVRSVNDLHSRVLKMLGVRELFRVEDVAAKQLATRFSHEGLSHLRKIDRTHSLAEVNLPDDWIGQCLKDVSLRSRFHLNMLTLRRGAAQLKDVLDDDVLAQPEQPVIDTPGPDLVFQKGDVLVLFGKETDLESFVNNYKL